SKMRRSGSHRAGRTSAGARPRLSLKYLTIVRAFSGDSATPFSAPMRRTDISQPSGVLRIYEMRERWLAESGLWHVPHSVATSGFLIAKPVVVSPPAPRPPPRCATAEGAATARAQPARNNRVAYMAMGYCPGRGVSSERKHACPDEDGE